MAAINSISTPSLTLTWDSGASVFNETTAVTVPSGATYLVVRIVGSSIPNEVKYNNVALTKAVEQADTNTRTASIYYLVNPTVGTYDLYVAKTSAQTYQLVVDTVSGVSSIGTPVVSGGSSTNSSEDVTTVSGDIVLDVLSSDQTTTVGAGQTAQLINTANTHASSEIATGTTTTMSWTHANDFVAHVAVAFPAGTAPMSITDVDSDNIVTNGQAGIVITGAGFEAAQGSGTVTIDGIAQTVTAWSDTAITITHVRSSMKYGAQTLSVTNDSADNDTHFITVNPASGRSYVDLSGYTELNADIVTVPSLVDGDQLEYENTAGVFSVTVNAAGVVSATGTGGPAGETFDFWAWDSGTLTWGTLDTHTITAATSALNVNDNFESYTLGSLPTGATDSATWGGNAYTEISDTVANGGTKSLRFRYTNGAGTGPEHAWSEQIISLGDTGYMELWVEFDLYTPTNFTHRENIGSNNKIAVFYNDYALDSGGIEYWADSDLPWPNAAANGSSYPTHVYRNNGTPVGHYPQPNYGNRVFDPTEAGTWHRLKIHYKKSDAGSSNASVQLYKDDVLLLDRVGFNDYDAAVGAKPWKAIKLMGWSNSGYVDVTDYYMDNLYISDAGFLGEVAPWTAAVDTAGTTVTVTLDEAYTTAGADYTKFTIAGHTISASSLPLVSGTSFTLTVDEISEDESLVVVYDASGNAFVADSDSSVIAAGNIVLVNNSTVDITAPVLSSPLGTPTGNTTATGTVTTDEGNGTLYWEVTASATPTSPNATFISDATSAGDTQAVSATGSQIVSVTGLSAATSYYIHFLHVDAATNESNIGTSAQFTTQSITAPTLEQGVMNPNIPVIDSTGSTLTLTFSEAVTTAAATGLTLSTGETLTYSSGSTTDTIVYTISPYAQAGGGGEILNFAGGANVIEATVGGTDVAAFSDALVSSQSTATPPVVVGDPTIDATGAVLTFYTDDILGNLSTPQYTPFSLTGGYTFSNALFTGTGATFTITPEVQQGDVVTLAFTQAGGEFTSTTSGLELQTFSSRAVTNNSTAVTVPPVFTSAPAVSKTTVQGHTIRQTIDKTGNVYGVRVSTGAVDTEGFPLPPPSPSQVQNGQDGSGAAALEAKSVATTAGSTCVLVFSSGAKNTEYDYYIVAEDSVPNLQDSVVKVTATTANLLFNGSGGKGLRPDEDSKKKVKMMWDKGKKGR